MKPAIYVGRMKGEGAISRSLAMMTSVCGFALTGWMTSALLLMTFVDIASCASGISRVGLLEDVLFLCDSPDTVTKPHYVVWHKGQKAVPRRDARFYFDDSTGSLTISDVTIEDEGNYTCSAGYGTRFEPYTIMLMVSIAPRIQVTSPNPVKPRVLEKLTVSCKATGRPLPTILWYSSKEVHINSTHTEPGSRFSIHEQQTNEKTVESFLVISPVLVDDRGAIACVGSNVVGSSKDNVVVDVQEKPVMLSPNENVIVYWWEGHKVNLTCRSIGSPAPFIVWTSFDEEGNPHHATLSATVSVRNGISVTSTLLLPPTRTIPLPAIYKCKAKNIYGVTTDRQFHVINGFIPPAPAVFVKSIKDDEIVLYISIPGRPVVPPVSYLTAYYRLEQGSRDMETSTSFTGNGTKMMLRGIMLHYRYVIRIKAFNNVGGGEETVLNVFSEEKTFTTPPPVTSTEEQMSQGQNDGNDGAGVSGTGETIGEEERGRTLQSTGDIGGANCQRFSHFTWSLCVIVLCIVFR